MNWYLVFTGRKWENVIGKSGITWEPAGVWQAANEESACLVAAQKLGASTCFAVEGYAWGVDLVDAGDVTELGVKLDPITRLERMGARLGEQLANALPASSRPTLPQGEDDGE